MTRPTPTIDPPIRVAPMADSVFSPEDRLKLALANLRGRCHHHQWCIADGRIVGVHRQNGTVTTYRVSDVAMILRGELPPKPDRVRGNPWRKYPQKA